ncbi:MAG: DUF1549 and DUF1553 domain-containing protein [Bryobacteraceae bacterium]|nr:DUF1549 and DUF1553 domain-containing protein [Bryobacteraceae bacterium]
MQRFVKLLAVAAPIVLLAAESATVFKPHQLRWWAIQPLSKPTVPQPKNALQVRNEIDAFLLARLETAGLTYAPPADKTTLLRRLTFDLTGIPPTPEELQDFLSDHSPAAYEKVVDRLLASPRYGERWARHWLDVARYADSEGFKADETRPNIWRYRDYVIQSLNEDKPYDRFVKEQIAGDELYPGDFNAAIATGFNRHFPDESNAANIMNRRQELLNDVTDTIGVAFLGVTVGCARCHDHKFDPVLQKDYYRLQAFFANTRIDDEFVVESAERQEQWKQRNAEWEQNTKELRAEIDALLKPAHDAFYEERFSRFPEEIQAVIQMRAQDRNPYQWQMFYKAKPQVTFTEREVAGKLKGEARARFQELKAKLAAFDHLKPEPLGLAQVMVDASADAPKTHVLRGGAWDAPLDEVSPGFLTILDAKPAALAPPPHSNTTGRRSVLAEWLASPKNPMTPRVAVNRIWHHHFGRGIVGTPGDFGLMGDRPSHPELLHWLAATFIEDGWSQKKLHRRIVLSNAYRQSSFAAEKAQAADPDNRLLSRFPRRRLDGEAVRDAALATAGLLNLKMYGPGVFPPRPMDRSSYNVWKANEDPQEANRRSVYVFVRRNARYPLFEAFDMPDTHESCSRRQQTVSVTQTLNLLNDEMVLGWAKAFAQRVGNDPGMSADSRIERAFRLALHRAPTAKEAAGMKEFLERQTRIAGADAALADLCHVLLNSNEFLYLD